jgi:outer membrane receptor protein involved in Fe transport
MRTWFFRTATLAVMLLILSAGAAHAQNAQVLGVVKDQSGGVMPGVTVTARNVETGLVRTSTSDEHGLYRVQALPPGRYSLTAEIAGFNTETQEGIVLAIDQTAGLEFTLKPAQLAENVTVTVDAPIVDTTTSTASTSVTTQQIQDLPVAARRWVDLAMLTPGTSQDNIRGFFYRGNVNIGGGTREYSNGFVVDGVNNTWGEMGEPRQNFAMDSIREFKVSTSNYKAEYGLATGGLLTVVSKSGTNDLHGSGLLFFRDKSLTSRTFFESTKPDFRRYQYGGTVGGPIVRNRTHFFFAYERTEENQFFTVNSGGIWPQYDGTYPSDQYRWTYTAKIDHQLSNNQTLFFRLAQENEYRPVITTGGRVTPSNSFDFAVPRDSAVVGHTWVMSPTLLNDFRFQYAYAKYEVAPPYSHGSWDAGDFGQDRLAFCTPIFSYPSVAVGGCGNSQMGPERRWEIKDDISFSKSSWGGMHRLKAGFDYSYITFQGDSMGSPLGSWTFPRDLPYDASNSATWPTSYSNGLPTYADIPVHHFSVYVQDDYQVGRSLTFNLGLRYDRQYGVFNEDIPGLLGKIEDKLGPGFGYPLDIPFLAGADQRGDRNNFGPRVGVAFDPGATGRMNIHAAYGMFYDNIRTLTNFGELTWPQSKTIVINSPAYPDALQGRSRDQFVSTAPPNITVMDHQTPNPYAHQVNVGATRMIGRDLAVTADLSMVWRYSDRDTTDLNLPDQTTRVRPYPQFARVSYWQPTADNTYKALLLKVEKRFANRYQFLGSYTLSKADNISFTNVLGDVYGWSKLETPANADRRHRLVLSGIVQLPYDLQMSAIADFRSALPFNPTSSLNINNDGYNNDLPSGIVPWSGCRNLNLDAVNSARTSRALTAATEISCPGFSNIDLRLSKSFRLNNHRIELIAQLFNIADRTNLSTPNGSITAGNDLSGRPLFGQSTSILANINAPSRQAEFAIRYQF